MSQGASTNQNKTNKQTIAYEHFWYTTQVASNVYKSADTVGDIEDTAKSLLDINPEGELLREIKDISDELDLMINVKNEQVKVFKDFNKHVESLIAYRLALAKELGTAKPKSVTDDTEPDGQESHDNSDAHTKAHEKAKNDAEWTLHSGKDISADLDDRMADLCNLKNRAERTEKAVS